MIASVLNVWHTMRKNNPLLTMKRKYTILPTTILILIFSCCISSGQHTKMLHFDFHLSAAKNAKNTVYTIAAEYPATGIVLCTDSHADYTNSYLVAGKDTFRLSPDEHYADLTDSIFSNLVTFSMPLDTFGFYPGNIESKVTFYFIDARLPEKKKEQKSLKKKSSGCSEPDMIDQSVWREGLTDPDYIRSVHEVHNCIIHHTAGSNTDTNYIQVIRNIYIYHTEIREWSDIGYNYLIAQDGTIFKGRDPGEHEQDNVKGAHFCNSNTGTMGISIMGNYNDADPTKESIESLVDLLNWKLGKDSLNPLGTYPHPLNQHLGVIAGHRDGCATECPGDLLYALMDNIREETMQRFTICGYVYLPVFLSEVYSNDVLICQKHNRVYIEHPFGQLPEIHVYDQLGRAIAFQIISEEAGSSTIQINGSDKKLVFITIDLKDHRTSKALFLHE
jgi:hypothetical protein